MPSHSSRPQKKDSATGWLMLGILAALGFAVAFLSEMAEELQLGGASGPGPILILGMLGGGIFLAAALGPIGRAVAKRILEGGPSEGDGAMQEEVHDLRLQVDDLRQALAELNGFGAELRVAELAHLGLQRINLLHPPEVRLDHPLVARAEDLGECFTDGGDDHDCLSCGMRI